MFDAPLKQNELIGFHNQFNEIINLFKSSNKLNKLLFSGKKGIGKSTFAYHFINYVFSINEDYKYNCEKNFIQRLFKRKILNRYDKFKLIFYKKVQKGF